MPPDVHRLLEREAQRVNSTILMNRRAYADLISNLLSGKSGERGLRCSYHNYMKRLFCLLKVPLLVRKNQFK